MALLPVLYMLCRIANMFSNIGTQSGGQAEKNASETVWVVVKVRSPFSSSSLRMDRTYTTWAQWYGISSWAEESTCFIPFN